MPVKKEITQSSSFILALLRPSIRSSFIYSCFFLLLLPTTGLWAVDAALRSVWPLHRHGRHLFHGLHLQPRRHQHRPVSLRWKWVRGHFPGLRLSKKYSKMRYLQHVTSRDLWQISTSYKIFANWCPDLDSILWVIYNDKKVQRWKPSLAFYNLENAAIFEFKPAFYYSLEANLVILILTRGL